MEPPLASVANVADSDSLIAVDRTGFPAVEVRLDRRKRRNRSSTKGRDQALKDLALYSVEPD